MAEALRREAVAILEETLDTELPLRDRHRLADAFGLWIAGTIDEIEDAIADAGDDDSSVVALPPRPAP
jgi:hypothetical protein